MPSLRIVCSSCGSNFSAPDDKPAATCSGGKADCAAPVCAPCAEALFPGRCPAHPWTKVEKLARARELFKTGDTRVPLVVTLSEAKQRRQQCLTHFEELVQSQGKLPDLTKNGFRQRIAYQLTLHRYQDPQDRPAAVGDSYSLCALVGVAPGSRFHARYEMRVLAHGSAFERDGFDLDPFGEDEVTAAVNSVLRSDRFPKKTYAVGLASVTGWSANARRMWKAHSVHAVRAGLAIFLVDLNAASVIYHWLGEEDERRAALNALADCFAPPGELEAATTTIRRRLHAQAADSPSLTPAVALSSVVEESDLRPELVKSAFNRLARQSTRKYQVSELRGEPWLIMN